VVQALSAGLIGMLGYGVATVLQAVAARRAAGLAVLRQRLYLLGLTCDGIAWLASLLALQRLPLFAVQALLAGSLGVTVLLARVFLGVALRTRDWLAIAGVALALVVIAAAAGVQSAQPPPAWFTPTMVASLAVLVVAILVLYRTGRPLLMAVVAALAFSGAALCARATPVAIGWPHLVTEPLAWGVVGFGVVGAVGLSRALEGAAVGLVAAVLWVVEVLVPGAVGVLALRDGVRPGWQIAAIIAVVVAVAGCAVLATSPAQSDT
jgi:drug/metabolite transporter (DMT)-like permease